ncbi:hypothetical protein [Butyrivibrio sp. FCS006]|uniref:hypothetical protein n=1 Tax=Butyrivibrio sp. FCS006 TaxID=1280684 RepID=UPI00041DC0B9|nr:hypothetical protein [Butyrivibrio sp. FCS006]
MVSEEYTRLINQINAVGSQKADGYSTNLLTDIPESEREEAEKQIWETYYEKEDTDILVFFPLLKKYDGINALKEIINSYIIPSEESELIAFLLFNSTKDLQYLELIEKNIIASGYDYHYITLAKGLRPDQNVYKMFTRIYKQCAETKALQATIDGILYNKGIMSDANDLNEVIRLRELILFMRDTERDQVISKLESGCFDKYKSQSKPQ